MASTFAIFMVSSPLADRATKERHAFNAHLDLDQPAVHCRAGDVKRPHVAAIENAPFAEYAIEDRAASLEEMQRLAVSIDHIDAAGGDGGDPEVAVGVDLESVGYVPIRHCMDDLLRAIGLPPHNIHRIGLDPNDGAVGFDDDAVGIDVIELFEDARSAVLLDDDDASGMRLRVGRPVAGIGEVEPAVRPEGEIVRSVELHAVRLGDEYLDLAGRVGLLNRRRTVLGRDPSANVRRLR